MEIGQKFLERYERFKDFQVCAAVHTNGPQFHVHYVVNTVSHVDGHKWQSSPEDLKQMRCISDDLCRGYGLQVYEKQNSGHRSYGEHTARNSWKKQLAADVARCSKMSSNRADFEALLWRCGVACDIGNKSVLFTIQPGVYGLAEERKCSNWKLMSYGDFSGENILKTLDFNDFVQEDMWKNYVLVSEVLEEFGYRSESFNKKCSIVSNLKQVKRKRLKFMMMTNTNYISRKLKLFDTKQKTDSLSAYHKNHFHSIE